MLKIRLQLQKTLPGSPSYLGPWGILKQVVAQEGIKGEQLMQTLQVQWHCIR